MRYPDRIVIREVSPRDGLQREARPVSTADKVRLIDMLGDAGFRRINASSFVSPRAVPQMADAAEVMAQIDRRPGVLYDASVPNLKGAERAVAADVDAVTVFVSASETSNQHNVRRSVGESLEDAQVLIRYVREHGKEMVGCVSSVFGCPYEGVVSTENVLRVADAFVEAGVTGLEMGDTTGEGTPLQVATMVDTFLARYPGVEVSLHLHDTRGTAVANVLAAMDAGCMYFDSAIGGLGGSPFIEGAAGNIATEVLVHMCEGMGIETGVDLDKVLEAGAFLRTLVDHELPSPMLKAGRRANSRRAVA